MSIIKSLDVGNGDMFYIKHDSDSFTIIDCNMDKSNRVGITKEVLRAGRGKAIKRFISTHPDEDHFQGLEYLDSQMEILNFYCVKNAATKTDNTVDFRKYCELRDSTKAFFLRRGRRRRWLNENDEEKKYGSAGIEILWPRITNTYYCDALEDAKKGKSPNNISPIIKYGQNGGVTVLWFGDLEKDFMKNIDGEITLPPADIIFAPHHGRASGRIPDNWLKTIAPKLIVIGNAPSDEIDYSYNRFAGTITQNSAGDIVLDCVNRKVHIYVSEPGYQAQGGLKNERKSNAYNCKYIGTLSL